LLINSSAARALVSSLGQPQYSMISLSVGGTHPSSMMVESGAETDPLTWSTSYCSLYLVSTTRMSASFSIFCNNSSMVMRGTRSEGVGLAAGSGVAVWSGVDTGEDVHATEASDIKIAAVIINFLRGVVFRLISL